MPGKTMRRGSFRVRAGDTAYRVQIEHDGTAVVRTIDRDAKAGVQQAEVTVFLDGDGGEGRFRATLGTQSREVFVWSSGDRRQVFVDGEFFDLEVGEGAERRQRGRQSRDELSAPMPAKVREVLVSPGQQVKAGEALVTLEAMKRELAVRAPRAGIVTAVNCKQGELVLQGAQLLEIDESEP